VRGVLLAVRAGLVVALTAVVVSLLVDSAPTPAVAKSRAPVAPSEKLTDPPKPAPKKPPYPPGVVTISAVGDIVMGSTPVLPPDGGRGFFSGVAADLPADVVLGNLEGTLTTVDRSKCGPQSTDCFSFRTPPSYARWLAQAGFTTLNLANNHAFDFGAKGLADTVKALFRNPGLVRKVTYRPSLRTSFTHAVAGLTGEQRDLVVPGLVERTRQLVLLSRRRERIGELAPRRGLHQRPATVVDRAEHGEPFAAQRVARPGDCRRLTPSCRRGQRGHRCGAAGIEGRERRPVEHSHERHEADARRQVEECAQAEARGPDEQHPPAAPLVHQAPHERPQQDRGDAVHRDDDAHEERITAHLEDDDGDDGIDDAEAAEAQEDGCAQGHEGRRVEPIRRACRGRGGAGHGRSR